MTGRKDTQWSLIEIDDAKLLDVVPPDIVSKAGQNYVKGYAAFFSKHFNDNTNEQYSRAIRAFFKYLNGKGIALEHVTAAQILTYAKYRTDQRRTAAITKASIRPHISAIREFFNACILCGALTANPAAAVKPPRSTQTSGTTPIIDKSEVTQILDHITAHLNRQADYRDRAIIATMAFGLFRVSAVLSFKVRDYQQRGDTMWLIAAEKGNKRHENPVHPKLRMFIDEHILEANLAHKPDAWLFPSSHGKSGKLNARQYRRNSAWEMVNRRARAAGVIKVLGNHSFRATGITSYMQNGGALDKAQTLAGHSHISTTKLYDRSEDDDKVEAISRLSF